MKKCLGYFYLTLYNTIPTLNTSEKKAFENILGKGENAGNQHFLLFIRSSKTGRIMGSPVAGGRAASSSLSGAYLQNYSS